MSKIKKILCLTLLFSVCMFPASAFASSSHTTLDTKKSFFHNIFSDKDWDWDWDFKGWFNWIDKKDRWDDYYKDSYNLWEKYYCY